MATHTTASVIGPLCGNVASMTLCDDQHKDMVADVVSGVSFPVKASPALD